MIFLSPLPLILLILFWPAQLWADFTATVIRITDGDTIVVRTVDFEDIKVRLYGIDCPERNQPGDPEATAYLRPLQGRTVLSPAWREIREKDGNYPEAYHGDTEKRILYLAGSMTFGYVGNSANFPNAHGEMCEKLKENGVDLFIVRNNESINGTSQAIFEGCVTSPDRYYQAASKSDISEVMAQMAQRQYHVRLSR
ncbi:MAG: hypothetical protein LBP33_05540 [Candidatus Adiutrix sp.]|nr:hypothetical protein [Candidatus Adiutrix sp.]